MSITLYFNLEMLLSKSYVDLTFPLENNGGGKHFSKLLGQLFKTQNAKQACIHGERSFVSVTLLFGRNFRISLLQGNTFYNHNRGLFEKIFLDVGRYLWCVMPSKKGAGMGVTDGLGSVR